MSLLLLLDHLATNYTRASSTTLPTASADLSTPFTTADYTAVSTDNATYVGVTGAPYLIQEFKYQTTSNTQGITITWNGNSTIAPSSRAVYLQIWNITTSTWETIAQNNTAAANTDFTLSGSKGSSLSSYYDATNHVTARVYQ